MKAFKCLEKERLKDFLCSSSMKIYSDFFGHFRVISFLPFALSAVTVAPIGWFSSICAAQF
ncbi:hypothetical protein CSTERTH_02015 [Thermoclostridium stercorarium subsp. thermolacticum DSM 2910]|uniref:Uncharacterized protein n=2 Tax=Thermoclostridium stercorarium TaxID=1510 RepID=A0A1B1YI51_THEST|nr:hypothetical protein CSTERTH_02015 [Thermoclostridium stercorarium subsp. thermolacticum DSM 2910]ANX00448.1 hypothetical protein CSTERLE_02005 [Thermoclostridium stercorarium subsp. leptospartum DSM 9219]